MEANAGRGLWFGADSAGVRLGEEPAAPRVFNEARAVAQAVEQGAFWRPADAWTAMEALRWSTCEDGSWGGGLAELWFHFVQRRLRAIEAIGRRGLDRGAFRHPRHARNALHKMRRNGTLERDLIASWQDEVERRIVAAHTRAA